MTLLDLGRIASHLDTALAHAMLHAVAVAKDRGERMGMGYCLMCGMLREVNRGVCTQCACDEYERKVRRRRHKRALARLSARTTRTAGR